MSPSTSHRVVDVETAAGLARAHVVRPSSARGTLVLGHGAGGGIEAPDLQAVEAAAVDARWAVALVEQPWRVAGRRVAAAPPRLDDAWLSVVTTLRAGRSRLPGPLVIGGRSAGARVACRTADDVQAAAVVALAFPLHPPGKPQAPSRAGELTRVIAAGRLLLVVQGRRDGFGTPAQVALACPAAHVVPVDGDHGLKADPGAAGSAVVDLLAAVVSTQR